MTAEFQSAPSVRRATYYFWGMARTDFISIRALREEGDVRPDALHGGLPRISIRALREEGDRSDLRRSPKANYFNPRPP